jgi:SAM-dependent methyltransferase
VHSNYYDLDAVDRAVAEGDHREIIGGLWDEIGDHQFAFLKAQGLSPNDLLLDVGCGSLRLGSRAIAYLNSGHYFGTDMSQALIEAGRAKELDETLRAKAPLDNFAVNADFDFSFLKQAVDVAIAQSVFTHLPLNHLRRCLAKLAPHIRVGGRFFVTYFECLPGQDLHAPIAQAPGSIVTHEHQDPYHYRLGDLQIAIDDSPWDLIPIGDWDHPRGQRIAGFIRR